MENIYSVAIVCNNQKTVIKINDLIQDRLPDKKISQYCSYRQFGEEAVKENRYFGLVIVDVTMNKEMSWFECLKYFNEGKVRSFIFFYNDKHTLEEIILAMKDKVVPNRKAVRDAIKFAINIDRINPTEFVKFASIKYDRDKLYHEKSQDRMLILDMESKLAELNKKLEKCIWKENDDQKIKQNEDKIVVDLLTGTGDLNNKQSELILQLIQNIKNDKKEEALKLAKVIYQNNITIRRDMFLTVRFCSDKKEAANISVAIKKAAEYCNNRFRQKLLVDNKSLPDVMVAGSQVLMDECIRMIFEKYFSEAQSINKSIEVKINDILFSNFVVVDLFYTSEKEIDFTDGSIKKYLDCYSDENTLESNLIESQKYKTKLVFKKQISI